MKAIRSKRAGSADHLLVAEVPKPAPGPGEVLVRIHATSVTRGDVLLRKMPRLLVRLFGEIGKAIPGHEYAGNIEAVGSKVAGFAVGDRVFGTTAGLTAGSHAEFVCVPANGLLAHLPPSVSYLEAAPVPVGAMTALHFLQDGGTGPGSRVLVNGASGSVGSFAVQIAKHLGAHVTGVASTSNLELVESLGADAVIDYTREDFSAGGGGYDVIFDAAGKTTAKKVAGVLAEGGRFVTTRTRRRERIDELRTVRELLAAGAIRAVVDRTFTLDQMAEAHRYVERGGKRGNVVVAVGEV